MSTSNADRCCSANRSLLLYFYVMSLPVASLNSVLQIQTVTQLIATVISRLALYRLALHKCNVELLPLPDILGCPNSRRCCFQVQAHVSWSCSTIRNTCGIYQILRLLDVFAVYVNHSSTSVLYFFEWLTVVPRRWKKYITSKLWQLAVSVENNQGSGHRILNI
jgi:hypothetical protein